MSHGQLGIITVKLFIAKNFTGACGFTEQLQTVSTAASEARIPDPSAAFGLQYLKNSVRGQRCGGDVLAKKSVLTGGVASLTAGLLLFDPQ